MNALIRLVILEGYGEQNFQRMVEAEYGVMPTQQLGEEMDIDGEHDQSMEVEERPRLTFSTQVHVREYVIGSANSEWIAEWEQPTKVVSAFSSYPIIYLLIPYIIAQHSQAGRHPRDSWRGRGRQVRCRGGLG
jgi:hypothetical protein